MQIRYIKRRNAIIYNISLIIMIFMTTNVQAYPGCCYFAREYHDEWEALGEYMKKFYTDAATLTEKSEQTTRDALPYLLYRSGDLMTSVAYIEVFDVSENITDELTAQYGTLYLTTVGPLVFDAVTSGEDASKLLIHPPKVEKSLMDFVVRTHTGAESDGELYGHQQLTKRETVYVKKEIKQQCNNNDLLIKALEEEIFMLELALAKYSALSTEVLADEKKRQ